jgi:hypothetical protein
MGNVQNIHTAINEDFLIDDLTEDEDFVVVNNNVVVVDNKKIYEKSYTIPDSSALKFTKKKAPKKRYHRNPALLIKV